MVMEYGIFLLLHVIITGFSRWSETITNRVVSPPCDEPARCSDAVLPVVISESLHAGFDIIPTTQFGVPEVLSSHPPPIFWLKSSSFHDPTSERRSFSRFSTFLSFTNCLISSCSAEAIGQWKKRRFFAQGPFAGSLFGGGGVGDRQATGGYSLETDLMMGAAGVQRSVLLYVGDNGSRWSDPLSDDE